MSSQLDGLTDSFEIFELAQIIDAIVFETQILQGVDILQKPIGKKTSFLAQCRGMPVHTYLRKVTERIQMLDLV